MLVVVIVDYRGEQKMSFKTHFIPFWERTKNDLRDTNEFNIDSLMGKKKMSAVFRNSCPSQSGVIVDAKVSDRQRRSWAPCRSIIDCKSSFTCYVLLGVWTIQEHRWLYLLLCYTLLRFKRRCLGIVQSVDILLKYDTTHAQFEQVQTGHLFSVVVVYNTLYYLKK